MQPHQYLEILLIYIKVINIIKYRKFLQQKITHIVSPPYYIIETNIESYNSNKEDKKCKIILKLMA